MKIENVNGNLNSVNDGYITFLFYDGKGKVNYEIGEKLNFDFSIKEMNLEKLILSLTKEIHISGIVNVDGNFEKEDENYIIESEILSVRKKGIKQIMNFGAVNFFATLAGGNPIKTIGSSNFYYGQMGMKITLKNNFLTLEGLLGEKENKQYLIKGVHLRNSINLTIDKNTNTIEISDLKERIQTAIERTKSGSNITSNFY
ncbi:MAG TPA: hypothetical protein P5150_00415 [Candidatus Ratteibacteria bacterium]|mgnify:FL=1|nr:hypothetical protein [Candidatus Ratteibacteria bacterium]